MLNAFRVEEFIKVYTVEVSIVVAISSSSGYYRPNSDIRHDSFIFKLDKWFCLSRSDSGRAMRVQAATTTVLGIILLPCLRRMFSFFSASVCAVWFSSTSLLFSTRISIMTVHLPSGTHEFLFLFFQWAGRCRRFPTTLIPGLRGTNLSSCQGNKSLRLLLFNTTTNRI